MTDQSTTLVQLRQLVADFVAARDWNQFHSPKNLSMPLALPDRRGRAMYWSLAAFFRPRSRSHTAVDERTIGSNRHPHPAVFQHALVDAQIGEARVIGQSRWNEVDGPIARQELAEDTA